MVNRLFYFLAAISAALMSELAVCLITMFCGFLASILLLLEASFLSRDNSRLRRNALVLP